MSKPDRIPCDVPGCRRTAAKAKYEPNTRIICGKHWRNLTRAERADFREASRQCDAMVDRIGENPFSADLGVDDAVRWQGLRMTIDRIWNLCIERAAGL